MDNIFNINRFGRLFIKHTAEHYKTYLLSLAVLIGVLFLGGSFLVYIIDEPIQLNAQGVLFSQIYILTCAIFTSTIFADFGDKKRAVSALTLPASNFEKFLVGWVWSYLVFSLIFIASFYLALFAMFHARHWPNHQMLIFNIFQQPVVSLFDSFALVHSFSLFGAIFFRRLHFIKTAFMFFMIVAILILFNTVFLHSLLGTSIRAAIPFTNVVVFQDNKSYDVGDFSKYNSPIEWMVVVLTILLWVAAYQRLKEKQV